MSEKKRKCSAFIKDAQGSAAIITGLVLFTLCVACGVAVEVTRIVHYKTQIQHAADSAVLAAISDSSNAYQKFTTGNAPDTGVIPTGGDDIRSFFIGNLNADRTLHVDPNSVDATVAVAEGSILASEIRYTATIDATLARIIGFQNFSISGSAKARRDGSNIPLGLTLGKNPLDIYFFLDNSPSMGIGARMVDIENLQRRSIMGSTGCAFACHKYDNDNVNNGWLPAELPQLRNEGLMLRVDEVRDAVQKVIQDARSFQRPTSPTSLVDKVRFAAYSFSNIQKKATERDQIVTISELSDDYTDLEGKMQDLTRFDIQRVGEMALVAKGENVCAGNMTMSYERGLEGCSEIIENTQDFYYNKITNRNNTPLSRAMSHVQNEIEKNHNERNKVMFLVTDGMANFNQADGGQCYENNTGQYRDPKISAVQGKLGDCVGPIDLKLCEEIKQKGTKIAVVYTRYLPNLQENSTEFNRIVLPQLDMVEENLKKCASPGLYGQSGFDGDLYFKIRHVFQKAAMKLKLVD